VAALTRSVPVSLSGLAVRPPEGYVDGLRGLAPLAAGAPLDDDTWATAVADLSRAAELDAPRRTRWLSALAACAELRSDPPARESAARWALDAAALPARAVGDPRTDPLPDAVALEPVRPGTWEGALRRARTNGAGPLLLAEVTLRWAYALVAAGPGAAPDNLVAPGRPVPAARNSVVTAEVVPTARNSADRVPPDRTAGHPGPPTGGATAVADPTAPDPAVPDPAAPAPGATAVDQAAAHAAVLDPAVTAAAEIMTETSDPEEYLRRVRPGFESLGATSVQLSRLVPAWTAPTPAPAV
jgi:hypothetical protein